MYAITDGRILQGFFLPFEKKLYFRAKIIDVKHWDEVEGLTFERLYWLVNGGKLFRGDRFHDSGDQRTASTLGVGVLKRYGLCAHIEYPKPAL